MNFVAKYLLKRQPPPCSFQCIGLSPRISSFVPRQQPHLLFQALRSMSSTAPRRSLNIDNINPHVKAAKYAVRGELAVRAEKYRQMLNQSRPPTPPHDTPPFDSVISANIGNPQQLDQKPITFFRQVASLLENPGLLEHSSVLLDSLGYKQDVLDRAQWLLNDIKSVGAYSQSQGGVGIRQSVARFIEGWQIYSGTGPCGQTDLSQSAMASPPTQMRSTSPRARRPVSTPSCTLYALRLRLVSWYQSLSILSIPPPFLCSTPMLFLTN